MISLLAFLGANHLATGAEPGRTGNDHPIVSPYGMFRTADGEVALAPSQEQSYQRLVDAIGAPELRDDPRFGTNDLRVANRAAMNAAVEARLAPTRPRTGSRSSTGPAYRAAASRASPKWSRIRRCSISRWS